MVKIKALSRWGLFPARADYPPDRWLFLARARFKNGLDVKISTNLDLTGILVTAAVLIFVLLLGLYIAFLFNRLYRYKNASDANLAQIRVAMKKRLDMIEQLLGAVKSYIRYERGVFETVSEMRAKVFNAGASGLSEIDRESRSITGGIFALAEAYPEVKANETVNKLMDAVVSVEDEIARHRYTYNNIIQEFNTMVDTIPSNLVARGVGLDKLDYLQFEEDVEAAPIIAGITEQ